MNENGWLIKVENLTKTYKKGTVEVQALRQVNIEVCPGEFVALMGSSGSGKSTLMHLLGCLDTPTSGEYWLEHRNVSVLSAKERAMIRNQRIGFVFQRFNLLPRLSAWENIALPLYYRKSRSDLRKKAMEMLKRVGLSRRAEHKPMELSGGESQRVAIARALVTGPALILADEPTGNLDSTTGQEIMQLLLELHEEGRTILLVTHDPSVAEYTQRVLHMRDGQIQEGGGKR